MKPRYLSYLVLFSFSLLILIGCKRDEQPLKIDKEPTIDEISKTDPVKLGFKLLSPEEFAALNKSFTRETAEEHMNEFQVYYSSKWKKFYGKRIQIPYARLDLPGNPHTYIVVSNHSICSFEILPYAAILDPPIVYECEGGDADEGGTVAAKYVTGYYGLSIFSKTAPARMGGDANFTLKLEDIVFDALNDGISLEPTDWITLNTGI